MSWGTVELEPEVRDWLEELPGAQFGHAAFYIDLSQQAIRIPYWIARDRRIILLTVFTKTKDRDRAQVARAKKAMLACIEAKHIVDEDEEQ
ncbi:MAG: type II toxin-antitoxin system RelE/ParE family toxin [Actinobacteria bacterium]|nr:type II toxin-antitoxin system RelE/ParE family toxin [Actinomycetota bacterium]